MCIIFSLLPHLTALRGILIYIYIIWVCVYMCVQCKTFAIGPDESAKDCVKIALDHLEMRDVDPSQYQLWAKTPREEPPYPLFGHEKPYSVKLSCLRDGLSAEEGFDLDHCNNVHDPLARCHFILRYDITDRILYNYISYYCITALPGTSA